MRSRSILFLVLIVSIYSCVPYKEIDIQYLNKPTLSIPADFTSPLILANLYQKKGKDKRALLEWDMDSVATSESVISLKEYLKNSPWFEDLDIPVRYYQRVDTSKLIKPIPWEVINPIGNELNADLIISLEYMKVDPIANTYPRWEGEVLSYRGVMEVPVYCYWRVYDLKRVQIACGYLHRDTLIWEADDWVHVSVGKQLPGFFSASAYAGVDAAERFSQLIAPAWHDDIRRYFHRGRPEMKAASGFVSRGDWINAAGEWQKVITHRNGKIAAKAAYNLALANEMLGNFNLSAEWLQKAKRYYRNLPGIDEYLQIIVDRSNN